MSGRKSDVSLGFVDVLQGGQSQVPELHERLSEGQLLGREVRAASGSVGPLRPSWGLKTPFPCSHRVYLSGDVNTHVHADTRANVHTQTSRGLFPVCLEFLYLTFFFFFSAGTRHLIPPMYHREMETSVGECVCVCV